MRNALRSTASHLPLFLFFACLLSLPLMDANAFLRNGTEWTITREKWTRQDEDAFSRFVQTIGEARCSSLAGCLNSDANPYHRSDSHDFRLPADCSKLPFMLRGYFAWKNGLPFGFVDGVASADGSGGDIRYTPGNVVVSRFSGTTPLPGAFPDAFEILGRLNLRLNSAMYRLNPHDDDRHLFSDLYPIQISREAIRPGTVIYDTNGHVGVVYRVELDGHVRFIETHPDNSLTRGTYGRNFPRSHPAKGPGFKNFRPLRLVGGAPDREGRLIGGWIEASSNSELPLYSTEQFYGNTAGSDQVRDWRRAVFVYRSQPMEYYDYVRHALTSGEFRIRPVDELRKQLEGLCRSVGDRVAAVQSAVTRGVNTAPHPPRLPKNIYGTEGEWEEYATPSRDAELRTAFKETHDQVAGFLRLWRAGSREIDYPGRDLKADLLSAYLSYSQSCHISYLKSDFSPRTLNLREIAHRIYALSFDPYHCVELRWGEEDRHELESCQDNGNKRAWYQGEQRLRNQLARAPEAVMGFSLEELSRDLPGNGVARAPAVDIEPLLR